MVPELSRAKRLIAASYNHRSADYARFAGGLVYSHLARPLAARIAPYGSPVLDVAGGTGALTRLLDDAVVADLALGQLANNQSTRRVQADAEALPFGDDSFGVAASAFGINHFPDPLLAVSEMARVAPVVGLLTWVRPEERPFAPKVIVLETIARHTGEVETETGRLVNEMTEAVGSANAVTSLLEGAGLEALVDEVTVEVPWPGTQRFIDFRLSMMGPSQKIDDVNGLRKEASAAIESLSEDEKRWNPDLVLGIGVRH
jgi:SAM-dependent methyltransferase